MTSGTEMIDSSSRQLSSSPERIPLQQLDSTNELLQSQSEKNQTSFYLLSLFLGINIVTLMLTVLPVLVTLPSISSFNSYYSLNDVIRLLEPIVILTLHLLLFSATQTSNILKVAFGLSMALYQQGAGFHSSSNMFKNLVRNTLESTPDVAQIIWIMRDEWEHIISHYMYAVGGILLSFIYVFIFKDFSVVKLSPRELSLWILAVLSYGLIIGSVAIQFVKGSIVALALILIWGFGIVGGLLWKRLQRNLFKIIRFPVLQYYLASYALALVITVGWMAKYGTKNRDDVAKGV